MKNYMELIEEITIKLKELSKKHYPKYKNYNTGELTEEYKEEQQLTDRYYELKKYERSLDPSYCHDNLIISRRLQNILYSL
jgi:hypothetical protein